MIITSHLLVGAALGARANNIGLAFIFGLISHYLLDLIPHWDYLDEFHQILDLKGFIKTVVDFIIGSSLILFFICSCYDKLLIIAVAGLTSLLPDFLEFIYQLKNFRILRPFSELHREVHSNVKLPFKKGWPVDFMVIVLFLFLLIKTCCII